MNIMISDDLVTVPFSGDKIAISCSNQFIPQHIGKIKYIEYTLAQTAAGINAKPAMELIGREWIFPDQVGKAPIAEGIQPVIIFQQIYIIGNWRL